MKITFIWILLSLLILFIWIPIFLVPSFGINPEQLPVTGNTQITLNILATLGALFLGLLFTWIKRKK